MLILVIKSNGSCIFTLGFPAGNPVGRLTSHDILYKRCRALEKMISIKTYWSKKTPTYGAFDDYVIIESINENKRVLIRPEEFEFLTSELFKNWKDGKSKHIQILKEWNECTGFNDIDETSSEILDIADTINAIRLVNGVDKIEFNTLTKNDLKLIIDFLVSNRNNKLKIRKI